LPDYVLRWEAIHVARDAVANLQQNSVLAVACSRGWSTCSGFNLPLMRWRRAPRIPNSKRSKAAPPNEHDRRRSVTDDDTP
jgi:hypothetical protein